MLIFLRSDQNIQIIEIMMVIIIIIEYYTKVLPDNSYISLCMTVINIIFSNVEARSPIVRILFYTNIKHSGIENRS